MSQFGRKGIFVTEDELKVFNSLTADVPYRFAKPIELWWGEVNNNRIKEEEEMEKARIADQERILAEQEKLKTEQNQKAPEADTPASNNLTVVKEQEAPATT